MSLLTLGVICLVWTSRPTTQRFVAAACGVVAEHATLLRKLHNKSLVCHQPNYHGNGENSTVILQV